MNQYQLISILNTKIPLSLLRDDYKLRLAHEADDGGFVSHQVAAKFLVSEEKLQMDREYQHNKMMNLQMKNQDSGDSNYRDRKGEI